MIFGRRKKRLINFFFRVKLTKYLGLFDTYTESRALALKSNFLVYSGLGRFFGKIWDLRVPYFSSQKGFLGYNFLKSLDTQFFPKTLKFSRLASFNYFIFDYRAIFLKYGVFSYSTQFTKKIIYSFAMLLLFWVKIL